ncbi:helix-turn-helix transcriptional regulator [Undibacterium arcticum]|uniref:Helix-turn-helix transcriptional regulator n=1 Tax=Undibacterium arcticum TaxID=1762892 RepID=A0ABV7F3V0_9BURK
MHYASAEKTRTERDFDPYGLAYQNGSWYAIGQCHLRGGLRSFRLDRVLQVSLLEISFKRPDDFDPLAYLSHSVATIPRAHAIEVLLKADMATIQREWFGWLGVLEPVADGVLLRSQAEELDWYARQLARLPYEFEIRHPPGLREVLAGWARRRLASLGLNSK